jgi:hypothetical protein
MPSIRLVITYQLLSTFSKVTYRVAVAPLTWQLRALGSHCMTVVHRSTSCIHLHKRFAEPTMHMHCTNSTVMFQLLFVELVLY